MTIKIERKIVSYQVGNNKGDDNAGDASAKAADKADLALVGESRESADVIQMHETLKRPEMLIG